MTGVLVTFLITGAQYQQSKKGEVYFRLQFVEVSVRSPVAPRQDSMAEKELLMLWCPGSREHDRNREICPSRPCPQRPASDQAPVPVSHLAINSSLATDECHIFMIQSHTKSPHVSIAGFGGDI